MSARLSTSLSRLGQGSKELNIRGDRDIAGYPKSSSNELICKWGKPGKNSQLR